MGTVNEETADVNLTATTAAATPCPEICEQTQNTGECSAGDQIFPIICKQDTKILQIKTLLMMSKCKFNKLQHSLGRSQRKTG